jgi:hypothetical protein
MRTGPTLKQSGILCESRLPLSARLFAHQTVGNLGYHFLSAKDAKDAKISKVRRQSAISGGTLSGDASIALWPRCNPIAIRRPAPY